MRAFALTLLAAVASGVAVRAVRFLRAEQTLEESVADAGGALAVIGADVAEEADGTSGVTAGAGVPFLYNDAALAKRPVHGYKKWKMDSWSSSSFELRIEGGTPVVKTLKKNGEEHKSYVIADAPEFPCTTALAGERCPSAPEVCACIPVVTGDGIHPLIFKASAAAVFSNLVNSYHIVKSVAYNGWPNVTEFRVGVPTGDMTDKMRKRSLYEDLWVLGGKDDPFSAARAAVTRKTAATEAFLHKFCIGFLSASLMHITEPVIAGLVILALQTPQNLPYNDERLAIAQRVIAAKFAPSAKDFPELAADNAEKLVSANKVLNALKTNNRTQDSISAVAAAELATGSLAVNAGPFLNAMKKPAGWTKENIASLRTDMMGVGGLRSPDGWYPSNIPYAIYKTACGE